MKDIYFLAINTRRTSRQNEAFVYYLTFETMPEMIRKLIPEEVSPAFISTSYSHNKDKYNKALKLSEREQKIVSNLSSDGFLKCETNLLYKLCQYFDFVTAPLDGWGSFNNELQNIGDAVEAIVKLRNEIIHNSNHDYKKTLDRMVEIAKVVDKELSTDERFEDAVKSFCVHEFDENYVDEFKSAFLNMTEEGNIFVFICIFSLNFFFILVYLCHCINSHSHTCISEFGKYFYLHFVSAFPMKM